ncbi:MAG: HD domain-containing phosphohydrolase [Campylobacterota bacterium]
MQKIFLSAAALLLILFLLYYQYIHSVRDIKDGIYKAKAQQTIEIFQNEVADEYGKTATLTYLIAQNPDIAKALVMQDNSLLNFKEIVKQIEYYGGYEDLWIQVIDRFGYSFYRSWTDNVGDHAATARLDIAQMLQDPKPMQTISTGRFDMTFKTMLPIFDGEKFVGMVESISKFNSIAQSFQRRNVKPLMLVDSSYNDRFLKPYTGLFLQNHYVANKNADKKLMKAVREFGVDRFLTMKEYLEFENFVVTLDTIKNIHGNDMGYFLFFIDKTTIDTSTLEQYKSRYLIFVIGVMLIFIFFSLYFINRRYVKELSSEVAKKTHKIKQQKENLRALLKIYDKHVIFSKTDLSGKIIHASDAFCKISGYSRDELMGKPHNIVRHPDMPQSSFAYLWRELQNKKSVKLEVKNRKKDGGFYWVEAEFEPYYDKNGKHIGYSAVRKDITANKEIDAIQREIIFTMGSIGESRSLETGNHVKRVALYSKILALHVGFTQAQAQLIEQASPMHDIGKVAIPDSILHKPAKLDAQEFALMKTHAQKGYEMLKSSQRPLLKTAATIALTHHEKYDGSGYPHGLKGEDIHIYGRITAIADVFDALGSDRCYKKAWSDREIFAYFQSQRGKHFDPKLVDIFFENIDEFLQVRNKIKDI